jgi:hypothetical protein
MAFRNVNEVRPSYTASNCAVAAVRIWNLTRVHTFTVRCAHPY